MGPGAEDIFDEDRMVLTTLINRCSLRAPSVCAASVHGAAANATGENARSGSGVGRV